ncbi:VIT and vWA domain-containing protein [Vibrio vulnificus]|uniref:VIT and vWA domain-containing protein n=1 Tax=Vibrio vulnificus TaxID=672 RepID=UPI0009282E79|nr:VIT and VWA domain-containing protein [Vibrio vulnificus]OJI58282.1 Vault protein inter-alpha-trypsin [Vibrio fluvialis]POB28982.1 hypothetical protein CRN47_00915 [Vibrio vulnificus]
MNIQHHHKAALRQLLAFLVIILSVLVSPSLLASGLLTPADSRFQPLTIQSHHVNVVIEDGYATTSIEQEFFNPNDQSLEALYSFPIPEKAVVGEFIYWINDRPVIAEAVSKEKAQTLYQEQKAQGASTAITDKNEFKSFDIRVFPVLPNQSVKIKLVYLQDALIDHGIGRYVYPMEEGGVDAAADAFWSRNNHVEQAFSFNLEVRSAYPIDGLRLPAHPNAIISQNPQGEHLVWQANVTNQRNAEEQSPNAKQTAFTLDKDITVYWRLQEGLPGRLEAVSYRDPQQSERGTIKLTFTPGDDLSAIQQGRDWVFVLDKSGSMSGKHATLTEGVKRGLGKLPSGDRFRILMFDNRVQEITNGFIAVNQNNVTQAIETINQIATGGGTNLYDALERAVSGLDSDRTTGIILVTDGVANVGVTEKKQFLKLMQRYDVRLYTFIMGNSANTPLLEPMTQVSNGFATSISNSDDILGHIMNVTSKLTHQAYRNIRLDIDGVKLNDLTPENIHSLYRGEQLTVFGHYNKAGKSTITLSAKVDGVTRKYQTTIQLAEQQLENPEIERLWAFSAIRDIESKMQYLEQNDNESEQAIESIALEYGLLTDYTSLLVVEDTVFEQNGIRKTNQQRVEKEQAARELRQQRGITDNRADKQQPMFTQPAPSHGGGGSGGGSMTLWLIVILGGALMLRRKTNA